MASFICIASTSYTGSRKAIYQRCAHCAPEAITFTGDKLIDILRRCVEANRAEASRIDSAPPATALLYALEDAFPCTK